MALLLREALGDSLRRKRVEQHRTLREVSSSARVSLGYLSEVERGRKEASSELLAAICDALDVPLADVLSDVSTVMSEPPRPSGPAAAAAPAAPVASADVDRSRVTLSTRVIIPPPGAKALAAV